MARFPVSDIPGVGPALAESLRRRGVTMVRDLAAQDLATVVSWVGDSRGPWLHRLARGEDGGRVSRRGPQKSVSHERTFPMDISDREELETRLLMLAVETGASLRAEGLRARTVTVRVRYADFTDRSASRTAPEPIESDRAIYAVARELFRELLARRAGGIRLLGVGVSKLGPEQEAEPELFADVEGSGETERDRRLAEASDRLRGKYGRGTLVPARIANRDPKDRHRGRGGSETEPEVKKKGPHGETQSRGEERKKR